MADLTFGELFETTEGIGVAVAIPKQTCTVLVEDARPHTEKPTLFVDLKVLDGPNAGAFLQPAINFPKAGAKPGSAYHLRRKFNGFSIPTEQADAVAEAFQSLMFAEEVDTNALRVLADVLRGQTVSAEIGVQKGGEYDGQNQLDATKPVDGAVPTPAAEPAAATATPAAAPAEAADTGVPF